MEELKRKLAVEEGKKGFILFFFIKKIEIRNEIAQKFGRSNGNKFVFIFFLENKSYLI
jgi:hypothetical protein